ncbi:hypothetical protein E3U23_09395 [Erythrobacter litoralis]|uniref:hypothetical protein n=1 Tax=Erythrobacter litoralis TaxID=39960 RepID=UPI0024356E4D|nr:hypothetical protein [Erythrobacter litoralis]MDG6079405.1 hypothetical protein [Erythrobacter litoralis]
MNQAAAIFQARYSHVDESEERRAAVLDLAGKLGADRRRLAKDRKAFGKWFDSDAVIERYRRRIGQRERAVAHAVERAGLMAAHALSGRDLSAADPRIANEYAGLLADIRRYRGEPRVREAAYASLRHVARADAITGQVFWIEAALRDLRRTALDWRETVWSQCCAFDILAELSEESFRATVARRLNDDRSGAPQRRDAGLFVRRHLARLTAAKLREDRQLSDLLERLSLDPEGCVRQAVAEAIPSLPADLAGAFAVRARVDADPQVRATLFAQPAEMATACGILAYRAHILRVLSRDSDEFVLRMAMDAAARLCDHLRITSDPLLPETALQFRQALIKFRERVEKPKWRRWASEAHERIWLAADDEALALAQEIREASDGLREGQSRSVAILNDTIIADPARVGRVMAVLAQGDFGLDLTEVRRPVLQRGDRFARRLWRLLFEGRHAATDKRQAFLHTIGRTYRGTISAPSARMAELAPTKVPGEPLFQAEDGNWRNWLPLVDHVLSAIDLGKTVRLFTSEGVTHITPPDGLVARGRSYWRLSRDFASIAELRNRVGHDYVNALRKYGVELSFAPHARTADDTESGGVPPDPSVTRFFSIGAPLAMLPIMWNEIVGYAATVFANTLTQLALFLVLVCLWFFGRHVVLGQHARRVRNGIALSLGGWGTRGKSGTERLKAGLINALGPPLVSKTTGCEAMFLNGEAFGELTEMFLFRPYDKATIWEQYNLIKITRRLGGRVFLWECMGLNPSYVRVLQRDWMRDDIGTLTNTYPDHEDVQGPAGRDIPIVMTEFIPENSICLTTEEEMLPILQQGARKVNTRMRAVNWRQAGLIHKDLLARFPYEEHPYNIALVTAMGDELGLEPDFCVKEMSDRVVADLGVLKTYPRSRIEDRTVEYVMGNSANERFGAMGNWVRMGFEEHDFSRDPDIYVSTVVNNRADRVPRSRVFARILVTDIAADKHFLIGSNIEGLMGFIDEEWAEYERALTLGEEGKEPLDLLAAWAKRQRVPLQKTELRGLLVAMIEGVTGQVDEAEVARAIEQGQEDVLCKRLAPDRADEILAHYRDLVGYHAEYEKLRGAISFSANPASHDGEVRAFLRRVFMAKLVPVRDYYIKGEQIVRLVAKATPPGLVNRIMGMQNIKGTGLDFVYRWQAWEAVSKACDQALDADEATAAKGIALLSGFQEYGRLSEARVKTTVAELLARGNLPPGIAPAQVEAIPARVDEQIAAISDLSLGAADADDGAKGFGARARIYALALLEGVLDGGDAVRRRRKADRIYEALIAEQISNPRAVLELKKLTSRQKGGWLANAIGDQIARVLPRKR